MVAPKYPLIVHVRGPCRSKCLAFSPSNPAAIRQELPPSSSHNCNVPVRLGRLRPNLMLKE
eukprot:4617585-Prorocentrum_lima.AAC.1